jgi:tetratricopeptide (TPR) repeat protein
LVAYHLDTLTSMNNLAVSYQDAGRLDLALALFQEAATGLEKKGIQHEYADWIINSLIRSHEKLKQFDQAEVWRWKWLAVVKKQTGPDSVAVASELLALGQNQISQKKWIDAEVVLRECLAIGEKKQPAIWTTFHAQSMLGDALLGQKKYVDAEPLLLGGYKGLKQRAAQIPPQVKQLRLTEALKRLVQVYDAWDRPDEAAKWRKELEALMKAGKIE